MAVTAHRGEDTALSRHATGGLGIVESPDKRNNVLVPNTALNPQCALTDRRKDSLRFENLRGTVFESESDEPGPCE